MREMRNACKILVRETERTVQETWTEWEEDIKMYLEVESEGVDWTHLAQDRVQW
jgi:hypothetical protein